MNREGLGEKVSQNLLCEWAKRIKEETFRAILKEGFTFHYSLRGGTPSHLQREKNFSQGTCLKMPHALYRENN